MRAPVAGLTSRVSRTVSLWLSCHSDSSPQWLTAPEDTAIDVQAGYVAVPEAVNREKKEREGFLRVRSWWLSLPVTSKLA